MRLVLSVIGWRKSWSEVTYVHDGDGLLAGSTEVLNHVLDEHGALGDLTLCERLSVCELM